MSTPKRGIGAHQADKGPTAGLARGKNYLLAIGIDKYLHFPQLNNAVRDARSFVELLQKRFQFDAQNTETLFDENATERQLLFKLRDLARLITPEDNLVIYFSGHGAYDDILDEGYWIPVDAERDAMEDYIPNSKIHTVLNAIHSRHTFLVVDSCFSGSLFMQFRSTAGEDRLEALPSRWGLTSGRNEVVPDGPTGQHSPFAESLLNQLNLSKGSLGVSELCQRVVESVAARSKQIPRGEPLRVNGHEGGQFFFRPKDEHAAGDVQPKSTPSATTQGSLLYSIPRTMEIGQESRCEVRVAFDKETLLRDFEDAKEAKVRDIRISSLMQVELFDPLLGGTGAFAVRTISSAEQFVDPSDYTQWIFYVKALLKGVHPLVLKVTVIETMEGRERRKEIVLEENINVLTNIPADVPEESGFVSGYSFSLSPKTLGPVPPPPPQPAPVVSPSPLVQPGERFQPSDYVREAEEPQPLPSRKKSSFGWMRTVAGVVVALVAVMIVFLWMVKEPNKSESDQPSPGLIETRAPLAEARKILETDQPDLAKAEELIEIARQRSRDKGVVISDSLDLEFQLVEALLKEKKARLEENTPGIQDFKAEKGKPEQLVDKSPTKKSPLDAKDKPLDSFTDQRDGKKYPAISTGGHYWLQTNLAYQADGAVCYDNNALLCQNLGGLYPWKVAMSSCPKGWRVPDLKQWEALAATGGGFGETKAFEVLQYGGNSFFQAQLAGMQHPKGEFTGLYEQGYFWTSIPSGDRAAVAVVFDKKSKSVLAVPVDRRAKLSCRCVQGN